MLQLCFTSHSPSEVMMNTLNAFKTPFPPRTPCFTNSKKLSNNKKKVPLCFCNNSDRADSSSSSSPNEGDKRKQELLARIAMLQTQKVRLTNYLDERAAYLTQFAQEADADFNEIGEKALKDLDDAEARIMEKMDNQMEALEETSEVRRQEIAKNEQELEDFEEQIERERNQDLFFKSLSQKPTRGKQQAAGTTNMPEVLKPVRETTRKNAGSKSRRNIYIGLMILLFGTIGNYLVSYPQVEWKKVAALGLILLGLIIQYVYEQNTAKTTEEETED
ncbi:hypothetical protein J5N97_015079 [Dioscorea zingiberensis]|uniref:Uncharacterized protein n=1 Tax=Dioscorea zingiberensis TaxID=325984 RepID=A0A9D5HK46_9LILI|nr:hypothetical protein J5N97_015079 [Dioscorea zingiberensis]